jgi:TRAP-type C4-dicarboxylate transport system substrate-binding protein
MNHKFGIAFAGLTLCTAASDQVGPAHRLPGQQLPHRKRHQFASDVDKATGGKLKITVHANASLFKAPEIKRAVQGAGADRRDPAGELPERMADVRRRRHSLPGRQLRRIAKLYKAQKPALEKKLGKQGMMLLYAVAWPPQGIYVKKPIESAADMKGLKWRAYSPSTARIAELVGAQPVTVQASELSQAMATGVIESYMSSGSTGYDTKTYEYIKNFYDTQAWLPKNAVLVNKKAFDALDKPTQDALLKAARRCRDARLGPVEEKNIEYLDLLKKNGMTVHVPSAQLKTDMKKVGDTMLKEWLKKAGPEGQAVVDAYKKM